RRGLPGVSARRTRAEGGAILGPGRMGIRWIGPSGSSENVVLWRTERLPFITFHRAQPAPHIPERHQQRRPEYGYVARWPDACPLPRRDYRGVRPISDGGRQRRSTEADQRL